MVDTFDHNVKEVSGPVNVVRMEGYIGDIKKVIYLFGDLHKVPCSENTCPNVYSKDIRQFFADEFYNLNKTDKIVDFFFEIHPGYISYKPDSKNYRLKYIERLSKFFHSAFKYDAGKNKVSSPDVYSNLRLHYMDIRDYVYYDDYSLYQIGYLIDQISRNSDIYGDILTSINQYYKSISDNLIKNKNFFENNTENKEKVQLIKDYPENNEKEARFIINKMLNSYKHPNVKKIMNKYVRQFIDNIDKILKRIENAMAETEKMIKYVDQYEKKWVIGEEGLHYYAIPLRLRKMIYRLDYHYRIIENFIIAIFADLADIFMLRRFLDKDYIKNAVVYTGAAHTSNYISILAKDFDFKVTHISFNPVESLDNFNDMIKKASTAEIVIKIAYGNDENQCSDLTNFPKNFD